MLDRAAEVPGGLVVLEDMIADWIDEQGGAAKRFRRFHWGLEPETIRDATAPRVAPGELLVSLGELAEIAYDTQKANELARWVHAFEEPRPVLAFTETGGLVIVGGRYRITERGIVG